MTEVNSVQIPHEFVELAGHWHAGQDCMLYAVASSGNLLLGTQRPEAEMSDEEWYVLLWDSLDVDLSHLIRRLDPSEEDYEKLKAFQQYVEQTAERLREEYGLDD